ncbi:MAG: hypothetical protein ACT4OZ_16400 [Gemmatimonadota bacterium]
MSRLRAGSLVVSLCSGLTCVLAQGAAAQTTQLVSSRVESTGLYSDPVLVLGVRGLRAGAPTVTIVNTALTVTSFSQPQQEVRATLPRSYLAQPGTYLVTVLSGGRRTTMPVSLGPMNLGIRRIEFGSHYFGPCGVCSNFNTRVTFGTRFQAPPLVVVSPATGGRVLDQFTTVVHMVDQSGFGVQFQRQDRAGQGWGEPLYINWIAIERQ